MIVPDKKLLVSGFLFITTVSFGQFSWGTRTGIQESIIHSENNPTQFASWKISYLVPGLFFDYQFKSFAVSTDLQFVNKGFKQGKNSLPIYSTFYNFHYLSSYLLFHYRPIKALSVFAGPEFSQRLGTMVVRDVERIPDNTVYKNKTDFGLAGGLSYQFLPGYSMMVRYIYGFGNVTESALNGFTNRAIQVALSSTFDVPKVREGSSIIFGFRQGIAYSSVYKLSNDKLVRSSNKIQRIGYEAAIDIRVPIKKYFFVASGPGFAQRGGSINGDEPVKIDYFYVPITFGISPVKTTPVTLSLEGGLGVYWRLKERHPYSNTPTRFPPLSDKTTASYFYGFEVSTDAVRKTTLFVNYRKNFGASFFRPDNIGYYTNANTISVGMRYRPGKNDHTERQETSYRDFEANSFAMGVKGGINFSKNKYEKLPAGAEATSIELGAHLGIFFNVKLGRRISFIPELQYIRKQVNFGAMETPLIFSYSLSKRINLETGPQGSILFGSKSKRVGMYNEYLFRPLDLGWNLGTRFTATPRVSFTLRYYHGFTDILGWERNGLSTNTKGYNRTVQVSTYFRILRND